MNTKYCWQAGLTLLLAFAMMIGFVNSAQADTPNPLPLSITASNAENGTKTLPNKGGAIRVNVEYTGMSAGKDYVLEVYLIDFPNNGERLTVVSGTEHPFTAQAQNGSLEIQLELHDGSLVGHSLAVSGCIIDEFENIVANNEDVTNPNQRVNYGDDFKGRNSTENQDNSGAGSSSGTGWAIAAAVVSFVGLIGASVATLFSKLGQFFKFGW